MSKIELSEDGRFLVDVRGAQVSLERPGRTYLGDVTDCFYDARGNARLRVRHFNGEPWPFSPLASEVVVLDRKESP